MIFLLYAITVFAWGLSWYAVQLQLGPVAPEVSVFYRFALAAGVGAAQADVVQQAVIQMGQVAARLIPFLHPDGGPEGIGRQVEKRFGESEGNRGEGPSDPEQAG